MKRTRSNLLTSNLQDDIRALSHYVAWGFEVQIPGLLPQKGSASSYDGFVLPRPLWGLLMQSEQKSSDVKYNRGKEQEEL